MTSMRSLIGIVLAFALATFAMPALSQNVKFFSLNFTTPNSSNVTTQTTEIYLAYKNLETGNSTFNAVSVKGAALGAAGVKITRVQAVGLSGGVIGTPLRISDTEWRLGDLPPTKKGQTLTVKLTVMITATSCTGGTIRWDGGAWTGSVSSPSTDFAQSNASPVSNVAGSCAYSVSGTSSVVRGATTATQVVVSITNSANSTQGITDVRLGAPAGVVVSSTTKSGFPIAAGSTGTITMNVTAPCTAGAEAPWTITAIAPTGFSTTPASNTSKLTPTGDCDLYFSKLPSSFASGVPTNVTVQFVDGADNKIGNSSGTVFMLVASGSCSLPAGTQGTLTSGETTISVTLTGDPSDCSLKATAVIDGASYEETTAVFKLYADVISCNTDNPNAIIIDWSTNPTSLPPEQFDGSPGTNSIGLVEYYKGARGLNDKTGTKTNDCVDVPYTVENNVKGSADDTISVPGKTIPKNGAALFWDDVLQPNATFRTVTTFSDEWTTGSGWVAKRTRICLNDSCSDKVPLKICLGTALQIASMPEYEAADFTGFTADYSAKVGKPMAACIVAEVFRAVDVSPDSTCTISTMPPGVNPGCIRTTTELLIIGDPGWDR